MSKAEQIPPEEARQIQHIVALTIRQLQMRYPDQRVLRGVHAKDHGCVEARFEIEPELAADLRVGVFQQPSQCYRALVRFSNADTLVRPDSTPSANGAPPAHGSRGMAIKLLDAPGPFLVSGAEPSQDFLMINQPVFAFANVEDYEVLSRVVAEHADVVRPLLYGTTAASGRHLAPRHRS
jgi:catalase